MSRRVDILCAVLCIIPILLVLVVQQSIIPTPSTHIFSKGGSVIDKQTFLVLIALTSIFNYFIAIWVGAKMDFFNKDYVRVALNFLLTLANTILILINIK